MAQFVWGSRFDELVAFRKRVISGGGLGWEVYHVTQLGHESITRILDSEGSVIESAVYEPCGDASFYSNTEAALGAKSQSGLPLTWKGHRRDDESALLYIRHRQYTAQLGRFMSIDPPGAWADPLNRGQAYIYGGNAPQVRRDPFGLQSLTTAPTLYQGANGLEIRNVRVSGRDSGMSVEADSLPVSGEDLSEGGVVDLARIDPDDIVDAIATGSRLTIPAGAFQSETEQAIGRVVRTVVDERARVVIGAASIIATCYETVLGIRAIGRGAQRIWGWLRGKGRHDLPNPLGPETAADAGAGAARGGLRSLGRAGSSSSIRVADGGASAAEKLFGKLSKGGVDVTPPGHPGKLVRLPDGGFVGYRGVSKSGPPTIDVNIPGIDVRKIKFPE